MGGASSDADSDADTDSDTDADTDTDTDSDSETEDSVCIESKTLLTAGATSFLFCIPESADALAEVQGILEPLGEENYSWAPVEPGMSICGSDSAYLVETPGDTPWDILRGLSLLPYIDEIYSVVPL